MQLWHGTADTTLNYNNFGEEIKQWTNVLGLSQTPVSTDSPSSGWTRTKYGSSDSVEAYSIAGVGHSLPLSGMAAYAIHFFGLDGATTSPPPTSAPPTSPPPTSPPPASGACRVADSIQAWNTGLTSSITITNTGTAAVNGWQLAFTLPAGQAITSGWSASYAPASGAVTASNASYDAAIPAGGSVSIGFQATHTGNSAAPASFTLNGQTCSTG
jgi:hypothetical protein